MSSLTEAEAELIATILDKSYSKNIQNRINGMLLYNDGNIIQVIEGEQNVVDATYGRISNDPRHYGISQLIRKQIDTSEFHRWSLGVHNASVLNQLDRTGGKDVFRISVENVLARCQQGVAQTLLSTFASTV